MRKIILSALAAISSRNFNSTKTITESVRIDMKTRKTKERKRRLKKHKKLMKKRSKR